MAPAQEAACPILRAGRHELVDLGLDCTRRSAWLRGGDQTMVYRMCWRSCYRCGARQDLLQGASCAGSARLNFDLTGCGGRPD